jgi:hypothetical protein
VQLTGNHARIQVSNLSFQTTGKTNGAPPLVREGTLE